METGEERPISVQVSGVYELSCVSEPFVSDTEGSIQRNDTYIRTYIHVYVRIYIYIYICIHTRTHTYVHT